MRRIITLATAALVLGLASKASAQSVSAKTTLRVVGVDREQLVPIPCAQD